MNNQTRLVTVKAVHTFIWVILSACVLGISLEAWRGNFVLAFVLIGIVGVEIAVLALNAWRCPLEGVAAKYTSDRSGNFDIYLPAWLASRTMIIFGPLYLLGIGSTVVAWLMSAN